MTISATNTAASFTVGIAGMRRVPLSLSSTLYFVSQFCMRPSSAHTDTPDSTSSIACAEVFVPLRGAFSCTITARKAGAAIYAAASAFAPGTHAAGTDAIVANERPTVQYSAAAAGAGATGGVALTATFGGVVSYASGILAVTDGVSANKPTILITGTTILDQPCSSVMGICSLCMRSWRFCSFVLRASAPGQHLVV